MNKALSNISDKKFSYIVLILSALFAFFVRLPYIFADDLFPLGDGGLFVAMINAIKNNHYLLPMHVEYNGLQIPFVYPPLGFYAVIFSSRFTGASTLLAVRYVPLVFNLLSCIGFSLLAFKVCRSRFAVLSSSLIFPFILQGYLWTIKGGGITRSPGMCFTILAVYFAHRISERKDIPSFALLLLSLSAAILSHPEWAAVAVVSVVVYLLGWSSFNWRQRLLGIAALGLGSLILTAPWWLTVVSRFGLMPLIEGGVVARMDAFQSIQRLVSGRIFDVNITLLHDFYIPLLAVAGLIVLVYKREFYLPVWILAAYFVSPKNAPIPGLVPLIFIVAAGLDAVDNLLFWLQKKLINKKDIDLPLVFNHHPVGGLYLLVFLSFGLYLLLNQPVLRPIRAGERAAMQFIAENIPANAKFVVASSFSWFEADAAEWFPFLSGRKSLSTPQGQEWTSAAEFLQISAKTYELAAWVRLAEGGEDHGEVVRYIEENFDGFDYVAIFIRDADVNFGGFMDSGNYSVVYSKRNALIFQRNAEVK